MSSKRKSKPRVGESTPQGPSSAEKSLSRGPLAESFPIVGVGASAGGLEAFTELLKHLPPDSGLGFVLVQHLDPQHESSLARILSRATSMPVREVTNNLRVEADQVYVIAPNTNLVIERGALKLLPRPPAHGPIRSIDSFFESLARDRRERAIGVVLSGTATDGTLGLEAIKAEGGITFAQDDSARYDSMPRSAEAAGCVDFVLRPGDIAKELARIAKHPYVAGAAYKERAKKQPADARVRRASPGQRAEDSYRKILLLLRSRTGVDFSEYKSTTIQRRLARRMVLEKQVTLEEYASLLRGNAKELDALYCDLLIGVTSFFRNSEAFEALKRKVFRRLLQQPAGEPVRVWVIGCSTGQEAYSTAMAFTEAAEKVDRAHQLQVFATDLNEAMLDKARQGFYPRSLTRDVTPERLRRFFVEEEGGYRVNRNLRETVVFAKQNLISDPPFSRLDLISCRNLLIYFELGLQIRVIPTLHYALKPDGFLFLGASESVDGFTDLFEPVHRKHRIYRKKAAPTRAFQLPVRTERGERPPTFRPARAAIAELPEGLRGELNAQREADRITVNQFAPPGVLINADSQILQFRGVTSAYLEPPTGNASFNVLKMAREGLMLPLRAAINQAKKENKTARKEKVRINQNGKSRTVNVEVIPLKNLRERCFLILFEDVAGKRLRAGVPQSREQPAERPAGEKQTPRRVAELERELAETRDYIQSIQEEHETASEELQASNEEVQSANEELQSLNEELQTSKEELESANEELTTLNEEITNRNTELKRNAQAITAARDFAEAIVRTVANPLIILDADLRIQSANQAFYKTFKVSRAESESRSIYDWGNRQWDIPELRGLLEEVLPRSSVFNDFEVTLEFENIGRRTMLLNGRRLEAGEDEPARILLGIQDITEARLLLERRRLEAAIAQAVEAEQLRLGQELHDGLAQELTGIGMLLDTLAEGLKTSAPRHADDARELRLRLATATENTRSLAKSFYPVEIERHGLLASLQEFARFTERSFGFSCVVDAAANAPAGLKGTRAVQLFRIAREAIHNAAKHAQAKHIHIHLATQGSGCILTVKDDGVGLRRDLRKAEGMGLRIMQYRAQMIGGTLTVRNDDEGGVIVSCSVPSVAAAARDSSTAPQ